MRRSALPAASTPVLHLAGRRKVERQNYVDVPLVPLTLLRSVANKSTLDRDRGSASRRASMSTQKKDGGASRVWTKILLACLLVC